VKTKLTELGGMNIEWKVKNSGDLSYEYENNCLQSIEGLEEAQLIMKGDLKKAELGFEFDKKDVVKSKHFMLLSKDPSFTSEVAYRMCCGMTVAEKTQFMVNKPAETFKSELAFAGHLEKSV